VTPPLYGDLYRYVGRRPRRALPVATIVAIDLRGLGRYRLCHTYATGAARERRTWIFPETLESDYKLVGRQEQLT
jgi:hypothetical protein